MVQSYAEIAPFPRSTDEKDAKNEVYRVVRYGGFAGPQEGTAHIQPVEGDDPNAGLVILDDAGNGFRDKEEAWPEAIRTPDRKPIVVLKMSRPLAEGKLWDAVRIEHADRLVVVLDADALREEGANISRGLSWERAATDFVWQMACNPALLPLANCAHLVVRFGMDGGVHYAASSGSVTARLYYDPLTAEGGFEHAHPGNMSGRASAFCAGLVAQIASDGLAAVGEGVRRGIGAARGLFRSGFGPDCQHLELRWDTIVEAARKDDNHIADAPIPRPTCAQSADPSFWCILNSMSGAGLEELAHHIVVEGRDRALKHVPMAAFKLLRTVDRTEIESYRSIRNLMLEYLAKPNPKRPLCIAVFGSPGSGKSFGVTQVAEDVASDAIEPMEFNMSQFGSPQDLACALHKVRDEALGGRVPLVFFDEFDSEFDSTPMGWLRFMLAPMQNGKFKDGESMHPIGKSIFVFAGGTCESFEEFARGGPEAKPGDPLPKAFKDAKGPDFLSRLRGYVNVLSISPEGEADALFMVRRAVVLRSFIERKASHLLDSGERARIDPGVLRAFIRVPRYEHGARSVEAIMEMSMLAGRKSFEQAALPPIAQLSLHVDADMFARLVAQDVLLGAAREEIAKAIHAKHVRDLQGKKASTDPSMQPWDQLTETLKESNRGQADHISEKLQRIGCGLEPAASGGAAAFEFTPEEIEVLAEMEHERFVAERRLDGWTLGPKSVENKTSPTLVPWDELSDDVKELDRQAVRGIPEFLAEAGFEVRRVE